MLLQHWIARREIFPHGHHITSSHWPLLKSALAKPEEADHPCVNSSDYDDLFTRFQHLERVWLVRPILLLALRIRYRFPPEDEN